MDRNIDNNVDNNIIQTEYSELMQKSYIDYAMSVIIARALPDVRDGLKPVQRRTLYDMHELGIRYDKPYRKSARIVGDTMGKYHPHGDSSIYDAMVVLAQDFKKGMPLIDGHGNFGSIEGDGAAAMRYTEARLQKITQEAYLADLDKNVVDFIPNYDETEKEPEVLPVKVPNLLINGAEGIAVGMATSIPPHNFGEGGDGVIAYMKNPDITTAEMMQYIKGPDFPTGGIVANQDDLAAIYETGQGKIKIRGRIEIEKGKAGKDKLVITEIPYTMIGANIGKFLNDVYSLVESKATTDIVDITNQSSKEGIRIVLELKKGADVEALKNLLYKKTKLEDTFGVNMLAVANGRPETLGLVPIIRHHVNFQYEIAKRKYETLLKKELEQNKKQMENYYREIQQEIKELGDFKASVEGALGDLADLSSNLSQKEKKEQVKTYLDSLKTRYQSLNQLFFCEDYLIDGILTDFAAFCKQQEIEADILFQNYHRGNIQIEDIVDILLKFIKYAKIAGKVQLHVAAVKNQLIFSMKLTEKNMGKTAIYISKRLFKKYIKKYDGEIQLEKNNEEVSVIMGLKRI